MDINVTLLGQMITFAIFIWFTLKFVWPPITKVLDDRQKKIAAGLSAAEQGEAALKKAREQVADELAEAKNTAAKIIENAHQRSLHIHEEAKANARQEGDRLLERAKHEIEREYQQARQDLSKMVANIAIAGAERILRHEVDKKNNDRIVDELVSEI